MKTFLSKYLNWNKDEHFTVTLHETCDDYDELVCLACGDSVIGGATYVLQSDNYRRDYLHKSCAELPGKIQHPLHPQHPLTVHQFEPENPVTGTYHRDIICDGCSHVSFGCYKYGCKECKFKLDFQCVSKNEGQALKERVEKDTIYHPHKLQLVFFHSSVTTFNIVCCCCLKSCPDGRDPTYTCNVCTKIPFFIHKSCLDRVPRQVQSSFHPEHPLFIQSVKLERCAVCDDKIEGFALTCDECDIKFHVSCSSRTTSSLRLHLHQHDMHYLIPESRPNSCTICKDYHWEGAFYRCVKCRVDVHMECIPLPKTVKHESHEYHFLKLTDSVVTHRDSDEYRCDICEEEGNIKLPSYYCSECNYIAHIQCVLPELEDDTSPKIPCLDSRGKGKAKKETEDAKTGIDDAEEMTKDEVYETDSSSQEFWYTSSSSCSNSEHSSDGQQYDISNMDDNIINIRKGIEELVLQLEAVANLDKRIENVKADMVKIVFQLEDHRKKFLKSKDQSSQNKIKLGLYELLWKE